MKVKELLKNYQVDCFQYLSIEFRENNYEICTQKFQTLGDFEIYNNELSEKEVVWWRIDQGKLVINIKE